MREVMLVPVDQCDPIEQIVPWAASIARRGMRVVFLVRARAGNWERVNTHITAIQTGNMIGRQTCSDRECSRLEQEKQSADAKLAAVSESLRDKGLETEVRVYVGGLKKALAKLSKTEDVRFVMKPAGGGSLFARLVGDIVRFFNPVKQQTFSPLVLIYLGTGLTSSKRACPMPNRGGPSNGKENSGGT